jgi:mono/diheme cytochrome c family protein
VLAVPLAMTGSEIGLLLTALAFIAFALIVALVIPRSRPESPRPRLGVFIAICVVFFAAQMTAVVLLAEVGEAHEEVAHEEDPGAIDETEPTATIPTDTEPTETEPTETEPTETEPGGGQAAGDPEAGRDVFATAGCATCHTLADANATGTVGPNLDESQPPAELVVERVTNGGAGMPSFEGQLTEQQIQDVAAYVSTVAGA